MRKLARRSFLSLFLPRGFCAQLVQEGADRRHYAFDNVGDAGAVRVQSIVLFQGRHPCYAIEEEWIERRIIFFGKRRINGIEARLIFGAKAGRGFHSRDHGTGREADDRAK